MDVYLIVCIILFPTLAKAKKLTPPDALHHSANDHQETFASR